MKKKGRRKKIAKGKRKSKRRVKKREKREKKKEEGEKARAWLRLYPVRGGSTAMQQHR